MRSTLQNQSAVHSFSKHFSQSGQVGIAVVMVMIVMATIGISLATRSASSVRTSRQTQEATQTFSAAEAALEDLLSQDKTVLDTETSGQYTDVENVTVDYSIQSSPELTTELLQGATAEINLSGSSAGQEVVIGWSDTTDCGGSNPASILVNIVNTAATPISRHYAYAICDRGDGFELVTDPGAQFARQVIITLEAGDQYIRITPVYGDTDVSVNGNGWTLPTQEYTIRSVAQNDLGQETKAIQVERTAEYAPSVFDHALVSGTTIIK